MVDEDERQTMRRLGEAKAAARAEATSEHQGAPGGIGPSREAASGGAPRAARGPLRGARQRR
jgi:hypothetical protein